MSRQSHINLGRVARGLCLGIVLLGTVACTPQFRDHGYVPSEDQLADIFVGVDTRETVAEVIGAPSSSGVLRESGYYYVSQRIRTLTYHAPEVIEREVVAISFDSNGVVSNVERFGLQDGNVVALSRRVTTSNVQGLNFLQQLFGNVGSLDIGSNI